MGRVVLATGLFVAYGYTVEAFTAWYSANAFEEYMILTRARESLPRASQTTRRRSASR
jgi:hypothetical protein